MKTNLFTNLLNWVLKKGPSETKKEQAREQADLKREQVERTKLGVDTCVEVSEEQGASEVREVMGSEMGNANHALITQLSRTNHPINLRCSRYAAVLFMVLMVGVGQMWGTIGTSGASSTFDCGTTSTDGISETYCYNFNTDGANSDTIVFSGGLLHESSVTYAYKVTGSSTPATGNSDFGPLVYNSAAGTTYTSAKDNGIYGSTSSNPKRLNFKSPGMLYIKVTNCEGVIIGGKSSGSSDNIVLSVYNSDLSSRLDSVKTIKNSEATEKITGLNPANTYYIQIRHTNSSSVGYVTDIGLIYPHATSLTHDITYHCNGGATCPDDASDQTALPDPLATLTKDNYTWGGWYTDASYSSAAVAGASLSADADLYAKFTQTITLDSEGGSDGSSSTTAIYNSATLSSITNPTMDGYTFVGWYDGDDGTGNLVINTSGVLQANVSGYTGAGGIWTSSSARTLYAKWEDPIYEDKIVWNKKSDYGGDGKCMSADDANSTAKNNNDKNDIGHSYVQISSTNTGMQRPANVDDVFTLTFTAKSGYYIQSICSYGKIEETGGAYYSWDGGTSWTNIAQYTSQATKTFDAPDATEPTSFIIKYTCTDTENGGIYWRNAVVTLGETAPTYTVTYDANGGTGTMTDSDSPYEAGATVTVLENTFERAGYSFSSWSAVDANEDVVDVSGGSFTMPSANVTITAQWTALVDTFKDLEHGSEEGHGGSSGLTRSGANRTTPTLKNTTPVNEYCNDLHYKFIGWVISGSVNDDGTLKNDAVIVPGEQSGWNCTGATYYAVWAAENE